MNPGVVPWYMVLFILKFKKRQELEKKKVWPHWGLNPGVVPWYMVLFFFFCYLEESLKKKTREEKKFGHIGVPGVVPWCIILFNLEEKEKTTKKV